MQYRSKPHKVDAFRFDGTFMGTAGVQAAMDWVSAHDIENAEVGCQGKEEPLALDVTTAYGLRTLEKGDWLYVQYGGLYAESEARFAEAFEVCDE